MGHHVFKQVYHPNLTRSSHKVSLNLDNKWLINTKCACKAWVRSKKGSSLREINHAWPFCEEGQLVASCFPPVSYRITAVLRDVYTHFFPAVLANSFRLIEADFIPIIWPFFSTHWTALLHCSLWNGRMWAGHVCGFEMQSERKVKSINLECCSDLQRDVKWFL